MIQFEIKASFCLFFRNYRPFRYNELHDRKDFIVCSFESIFIGIHLKRQEPTVIYFLILKSCQCCLVVLLDMGSQTFDIYFSFHILCNGNFWSKKLLPCMKKKLFLLWENMSQVFYYDISKNTVYEFFRKLVNI